MCRFVQADRVFVKILPKNVDISKPMERELRMVSALGNLSLLCLLTALFYDALVSFSAL